VGEGGEVSGSTPHQYFELTASPPNTRPSRSRPPAPSGVGRRISTIPCRRCPRFCRAMARLPWYRKFCSGHIYPLRILGAARLPGTSPRRPQGPRNCRPAGCATTTFPLSIKGIVAAASSSPLQEMTIIHQGYRRRPTDAGILVDAVDDLGFRRMSALSHKLAR